jgi:protein-L-isoaspartate(D-aspartate) O-methyltransferase
MDVRTGSWEEARRLMVEGQLKARGIRDPAVLAAMGAVPRHRFVPAAFRSQAYADRPLPIGGGQTISQPFIVAYMAEVLGLDGTERILEVGSGSGYAAAVLARLAREVVAVERDPDLRARSRELLADLGCANVEVVLGDGSLGLPDRAPWDAVLLSCAARELPAPLWEQLGPGGRILAPLGPPGGPQDLVLARRGPGGPSLRSLLGVIFVPLVQDRQSTW